MIWSSLNLLRPEPREDERGLIKSERSRFGARCPDC
jgi:hypothetical protein